MKSFSVRANSSCLSAEWLQRISEHIVKISVASLDTKRAASSRRRKMFFCRINAQPADLPQMTSRYQWACSLQMRD